MIDYIKGNIEELTPTFAIIECNGIGYFTNISLNTYTYLVENKKNTKLYIYESIREDAHVLFGFDNTRERDIFILLLSVSGVGPSTARIIISSLTCQEIEHVIYSEKVDVLKSVKGIGAKTAQRIIVDLKDKIRYSGEDISKITSKSTSNILPNSYNEAISALIMLGFSKINSQKVVSEILKQDQSLSVQHIIKESLKRL